MFELCWMMEGKERRNLPRGSILQFFWCLFLFWRVLKVSPHFWHLFSTARQCAWDPYFWVGNLQIWKRKKELNCTYLFAVVAKFSFCCILLIAQFTDKHCNVMFQKKKLKKNAAVFLDTSAPFPIYFSVLPFQTRYNGGWEGTFFDEIETSSADFFYFQKLCTYLLIFDSNLDTAKPSNVLQRFFSAQFHEICSFQSNLQS